MSNFNDFTFLGSIVNVAGDLEKPNVTIFAPNVSGSPTQTRWTLGFIWTHPVTEFVESDIKVAGDISGTPIENFAGSGYDYTCDLILKHNSQGTITITIEANSAEGNGTTGPPEDVSVEIAFDTRPIAQPQNILCVRELNNSRNPDLGLANPGGVFRNIKSAVKLGNYIYFVAQIQRHGGVFGRVSPTAQTALTFIDDGATFFIPAGAVLYRLDITDCSFEIIKQYKNVTTAARSLTEYKNRVYGVEGSHYAHLNDGIATDVISGDEVFTRGRFRDIDTNWKSICGNIFSIGNSDTEISQHGIVVSANPEDNPNFNEDDPDAFYGTHYGTASPMLADTDEVSAVLGYGDYDEVVDPNAESEVSRYKNLAFAVMSEKLSRNIPVLRTNDRSAFDIISQIATLTDSIIYFDNGVFTLKPRINEDDPAYTLELNALSLEQPIDDVFVSNDISNLWNAIKITYADGKVYTQEDEDSINLNKRRKEQELSVELDDINLDWVKWIAETFLARFSAVRRIVVCQLKPSPHIKLGDKVKINAQERMFLNGNYQVIEHNKYIQEQRSEVRFVSV